MRHLNNFLTQLTQPSFSFWVSVRNVVVSFWLRDDFSQILYKKSYTIRTKFNNGINFKIVLSSKCNRFELYETNNFDASLSLNLFCIRIQHYCIFRFMWMIKVLRRSRSLRRGDAKRSTGVVALRSTLYLSKTATTKDWPFKTK